MERNYIKPLPIYESRMNVYSGTEVYRGSASSGKSWFIASKLVQRAIKEPGITILAVRKVKDTCRDSVFKTIWTIIENNGLTMFFKKTTSPMSIKCINGSEFLFFGMDNPEKLKSLSSVECIFMEEADQMISDDYELLMTRFRGQYTKQMILAFNPTSKTSWLYDYFFADNPLIDDAFTLKTTYHDNPFVSDETANILEGLKRTSYNAYLVYCLGNWGVLDQDNSILSVDRFKEAVKREVIPQGKLLVGIDPAGNGRDKTVITIFRGNKHLSTKELSTDDVNIINNELILQLRKWITPNDFISIKIDSTGIGGYLPKSIKSTLVNAKFRANIEVLAINFAQKAINDGLYEDIIAEMYFNVVNKIDQLQLIHSDYLEQELCMRLYEQSNKYRIKLQSKDKFKKEIRRSPDYADSLVLALYEPKEIKAQLKTNRALNKNKRIRSII